MGVFAKNCGSLHKRSHSVKSVSGKVGKLGKIAKKDLTNSFFYVIICESQERHANMRVLFNGRTPAFQAGSEGSIPFTRSTFYLYPCL